MTSLRGALVWSLLERYTSLLITLVSTFILARLLTPTQIGIFSMCAAVTTVAGILRDFGVSEYLIQEKELTREKIRGAFGVALLVAWAIGAMVFFASHSIAAYYNEPGLRAVLAVLSLNFLLLPFASPAFALLNREMAFRPIFAIQTSSNAAQCIVAVVLAYQGFGYMSLAWASVSSIFMQTILLGVFRPQGTLMLPSFNDVQSVLKYGSMFATSRVIETFARNAHEFILARQFGFASVGIFSRAFGLIELFYINVASAILRVATPSFASDHRAGEKLTQAFANGTAILTCLAWPFFAFVALMSKDIVLVLFGPQWNAAAPIATILALTVMPNYLYILGPNLLAATGHVQTRLKISIIFSPIHLLGVFAASWVSLPAVAAVWFATNLVILALYVYHLRRILGASATELFLPSLNSFFIALITVLAQLAVVTLCHGHSLAPALTLASVVIVGAAVWLLAIWAFRHPAANEVSRAFGHVWSRTGLRR